MDRGLLVLADLFEELERLGVQLALDAAGHDAEVDVLVAADAWGYVWYLGALMVLLALLLPRAWFRDVPGRATDVQGPDPHRYEP